MRELNIHLGFSSLEETVAGAKFEAGRIRENACSIAFKIRVNILEVGRCSYT